MPTRSAYAASKGAVISLTYTAAQQLARHDINVNAICPGLIDTARMDDLKGQEGWHALVDRSALGRAGEPIDIKVNKLDSIKTQLPYDYYSLPFCQPDAIEEVSAPQRRVCRCLCCGLPRSSHSAPP